jgi:uncharacterized repeat protein (TIGR02543 family)
VATGVALFGVVGALGAFGASGYPTQKPRLLSGMAWVASSAVGQLTLLDGASAEVAAQVQVAASGNDIDVVQQGANAYAVNHTKNTVRRVDGATYEPSAPATPIPDAGAGLQAFASTNVLYALDTQRGVFTGTDPGTLAPRGPLRPLAAQVTEHAAALDSAGRLWVLDTSNGDLVWLDQGESHVRHHAASPGDGTFLTLAGDTPVLVDSQSRTATLLDPATGDADRSTTLDLRSGDRIQVAGAPHAQRLYLVASRGVLVVCDLAATNCSTAVPIGSADADLGTPIEAGGRVFVPDYGTGQVWIVDLTSYRVVANPQVVDPRTHFQLLTRDGVVFFNDPGSEHAGIIRLDGGVKPVSKYDPKSPDKGLSNPDPGSAPKPSTPPNTPASTAPSQNNQDSRVVHKVQIVVSTDRPRVRENVAFKVIAKSGPGPSAARWSFGDGGTANDVLTNHQWNAVGTYQVNVTATFPDGRTAVASMAIQVVNRPRLTVRVAPGGTVTGGGIACPPTCSITVDPGRPVGLTAQPTQPGYTFTRWQGGCTGTTPACAVTVTTDTTVSAEFTGPPAKANVTITVGGSGTGSVTSQPAGISCQPGCTASFTVGTQIQLTAAPGSGSSIGSWTGACAGAGTRCLLTVPAGGAQVSVNFIVNRPVICQGQTTVPGTYHLELDPTCGGIMSGDLWWEQVDAAQRKMVPLGGARIARIGVRSATQFNNLTWDNLRTLSYSATPIDGSDTNNLLQDGTVFAVATSGGHLAKVRVVSHNYTNTPWSRDITLRYVTYQ